MDIDINWHLPPGLMGKRKVQGKKNLLFLANECRRLMDPYVPAQNMMLSQNVETYSDSETGYIKYNSPYAHYQYEGEVYGPNYPVIEAGEVIGFRSPPHKYPTGRKLNHSKFRHPLATSKWDKAMMLARGDDLTKSYEEYLRSRTDE